MSFPKQIGPFEIEGLLHEGGMGVLYLARDAQKGFRVVVKVARFSEKLSDAERAFYDEAIQGEMEILRELHHPHIVRLYPLRMSDEEGGGGRVVYIRRAHELPKQPWYFAMEYLGGGSLEDLLKARRMLPIDVAVEIAYQIAMALEYLHSRGIAHRDIKPQNILFRRPVHEGIEAVLVDFGLAQRQRARGLEAGTLLYMAPEQIEAEKGGTSRGDPRQADIYAMGVVLYRMVTGRLPFEGRSKEELTSAIRKMIPTRPSILRKDVPAPLDDLIFEMLAKDPDKRPDASWVARRLNEAVPWHRRFLELEEKLSSKPPLERPRSPARSALQAAITMGLLILAIAGWGLYLKGGHGGSETLSKGTATPALNSFATPTPVVILGGGEATPTRTVVVERTATPRPTRTPTPTIPPPPPPPPSPTP
ncbi:MAG: serine/threonine-protein kinase [Thermoflexus sp.]